MLELAPSRTTQTCRHYKNEAAAVEEVTQNLFPIQIHTKIRNMKLHCLLSVLSGIAESKKSHNRGKAPREDMSQVRSHWKDAMCILEPTKCNKTCTKTLTALKGEINVTAAEYQASKHCAWTIKVPVGKEIRLQWTRMDLEWHKHCAYDKVHIVDGLSGSRLGRWCGPRYHDPVNTPWDGERRFRRVCKTSDKTNCEALDMWDTPFNTLSNEIIVAFDTDEYHQVCHILMITFHSHRMLDPI